MCCAPCSTYPVEALRNEGFVIEGFFYNPNIHPYTEYKQRMDTAAEYCKKVDLPLIMVNEYNIEKFLRNCVFHENERCEICYTTRLEECAKTAKDKAFDAFTSSLLVSPYQKHDSIKKIGSDLAEKYGIEFIYRDFRPGFRQGQEMAKQMELYRQKYCGCIYSEAERYGPKHGKESL